MLTQQRYYTPDEYLHLEEAANYKSEYIDGQIVPMAGGSTNHNQIALNISTELNYAFKRQDYRVFMADVRLWIPQKRIYTYPDVMAIAGEPDYYNNRTDTVTNPLVIIEVLSKSTQAYDFDNKFGAYRTIASLKEYILIDQTRIHIDQFTQTGKKRWELREYDAEDDAIALTSIPLEIALVDVYNKVKFAAADLQHNDTTLEELT